MTTHLSPEELRQEYVRVMGPDLGTVYYELFSDIAWLHLKWEQYRELFGKDDERIALLNRTAPLFFGFLDGALFEDVLLHVARLTDPPKSLGHENLSLTRLPELVPPADLRDQIEEALQVTLARSRLARDWRNRRLAHADLATALGHSPATLEHPSRQSVEEALAAMRDLLNVLETDYRGGATAYDFLAESGGADFLVHYLALGLEAEEARRRRGKREINPDAA